MSNDDLDDPIADAFLGESDYERLRVQRLCTFTQPIDRKLRWLSGLLFALAATFPMLALVPPTTSGLFPGGDPTGAMTKVLLVGLFGGLITFGGGIGLVYVAVRTRMDGRDLTERRAWSLLTLEEMCSYLGVVTGGFAIAISVGLHLMAAGGTESTTAYVEAMGQNPFAGIGAAVPSALVAAFGAVSGLVLLAASQYLARD